MASPVLPAALKDTLVDSSSTLCGNFRSILLQFPVLVYRIFNWMLDADGNPTEEFTRSLVPAGGYLFSASATVPTGYLLCNGQLVSRTTYAALFAAIGVVYGAGDGTTTFGIPNFQDRFPIGASETKALAATGGADTVTLTLANSPPHRHFIVGNETVDDVEDPVSSAESAARKKDAGGPGDYSLKKSTLDATVGRTSEVGGLLAVATPHANMPPWLACMVFIKT